MPFTPEQKREYYRNNPEAHAAMNKRCRENFAAKYRNDPEFRERVKERALMRYYKKKNAAAVAAELEGRNTLESSSMVVRVN